MASAVAGHTPGPWSFRQIDSDGLGYIQADDRDIMHAGVNDRHPSENIANAKLTAAAPDLYSALHNAAEFLQFYFVGANALQNRIAEGNENVTAEAQKAFAVAYAALNRAEQVA